MPAQLIAGANARPAPARSGRRHGLQKEDLRVIALVDGEHRQRPVAGTGSVAPRTQSFMMINEPPVVWPGKGTWAESS
jgi:hypothetical protein